MWIVKMLIDWVVTTLVLVAAIAIDGAHGDTTVTGSVFCDQCKDGQFDSLDYPLGGVRVLLACPGENGQYSVVRQETTNWLGTYTSSFQGTADMGSCRAQVSDNGEGCGAVVGPAQDLRLSIKMFDSQTYTVDPLVAQPAVPSPLCPSLATPLATPFSSLPPPLYLPPLPPSQQEQPLSSMPPPPMTVLPAVSPPTTALPPVPELLPMSPLPPLPPLPSKAFFESSACPYQMWMLAQYRCYWMLNPELKVGLVFGPLATTKYGPNVTLRESINGMNDPYQTLLREGTTALLNSYTSTQFVYQPVDVVRRLNLALTEGTSQQLLMAAIRFIKANSGQTGNTTCKFSACT